MRIITSCALLLLAILDFAVAFSQPQYPPSRQRQSITLPSLVHMDGLFRTHGRWAWGACDRVASAPGVAYIESGPSFLALDTRDAENPRLTWSYTTDGNNFLLVDGATLYAIGRQTLLVFSLADVYHPVLIAELSLAGYSLPGVLACGDSVLFVGTIGGEVVCIDITDPSTPVIRGVAPTTGANAWTLVAIQRRAFISEFSQTLAIDATNLDSILVTRLTGLPAPIWGWGCVWDTLWAFSRSQEIFVYSIADPDTPRLLSCTVIDTTVAHLLGHDTLLYVASSRGDVLSFGLRDPAQPQLLDMYAWHEPQHSQYYRMALSDSVLYLTNSLGVLTLSAARTRGTEFRSFFPTSYYMVKAEYEAERLFVASGWSGLWTLDVSDPENPREVVSNRMGGWCNNVHGAFPYLFATCDNGGRRALDTFAGLWVFDVGEPDSPVVVNHVRIDGAQGMARSGSLLFVSRPGDGTRDTAVQILDVSGLPHVMTVGAIPGGYRVSGLAARDSIAYLASRDSGLFVFDCRNPAVPRLLARRPGRRAEGVLLDGEYAFVHMSDSLTVLHAEPPESLRVVGKIRGREDGYGIVSVQMALIDSVLLCAGAGLYTAFNVNDPTLPLRIEDSPLSPPWGGFGVHEDTVYLLGEYNGLWVVSIDRVSTVEGFVRPADPGAVRMETYPNPGNGVIRLRIAGDQAGDVSVILVDVLGRRVRTVYEGEWEGVLETSVDTKELATGTYFFYVRHRNTVTMSKVLVIK